MLRSSAKAPGTRRPTFLKWLASVVGVIAASLGSAIASIFWFCCGV